MSAGWPADRTASWGDHTWWTEQIDEVVATADPVLCNLRITVAHEELSRALRRVLGDGVGANFHSWAVWGSKKAGTTIRQEDLPSLRRIAPLRALSGRWRDGATEQILAGNRTVLDDIGRQSARFVSTFHDPGSRAEDRLARFVDEIPAGGAPRAGEPGLAGAYRHWFAAARAEDPDGRDENMLLGNLMAILHEHRRLEPFIDASIPRPLRRVITETLLRFSVGGEVLSVGQDVPAPQLESYSRTLRTIESPELEAFLEGWDRTPGTVAGSAAADWSRIEDRMNFIVDLFRTRQQDPNLVAPPYTDAQRDLVLAREIPPGPL
jgi:hypothetical protein